MNSIRDGVGAAPRSPVPASTHEFDTDGVGAGLVPARLDIGHELHTGRDKPVPYNPVRGLPHEFEA